MGKSSGILRRANSAGEINVVRFVAVLAALTAVVVIVAGCGSSSGNSSISSGVSLPDSSSTEKSSGGEAETETYAESVGPAYYKELVEKGINAKTARCYVKAIRTLPQSEAEEFLTPGEISKDAAKRLSEFNANTEAECVGKSGVVKANTSPAEREKFVKGLAETLGSTLEAEGIPDEAVSCVVEGIEKVPYATLVEVTEHKAEAATLVAKVGKECNASISE
jgi:hypothetical protein